MAEVLKSSERQTICEKCTEVNEDLRIQVAKATHFCVQCNKVICDRCCRDHKRYKELQEHEILPIESTQTGYFTTLYCNQHGEQQLKRRFCFDCKQMVCALCHNLTNGTHRSSDVDEGLSYKSCQEVANYFQQIRNSIGETSEKIQRIDDEMKNFPSLMEDIKKKISKREVELKCAIDRCTEGLRDQLDSIEEQRWKQMEAEKEASEAYRSSMRNLELHYDELISKDSLAEISRKSDDFRGRLSEINANHRTSLSPQIPALQVSFEASKLEDFMKTENLVGSLKVQSKIHPKEKSKKKKTAVRCVGQLDSSVFSSSNIRGMAKLEKNIYILCDRPYSVLVYEGRTPFTFQKRIALKDIVHPVDLASGEVSRSSFVAMKDDSDITKSFLRKLTLKDVRYPVDLAPSDPSKCLYITDKGYRCIWKLTANDHKPTKWTGLRLDKTFASPFTLSVSHEDQLILCRKQYRLYQPEIYHPDGIVSTRFRFQLPSRVLSTMLRS